MFRFTKQGGSGFPSRIFQATSKASRSPRWDLPTPGPGRASGRWAPPAASGAPAPGGRTPGGPAPPRRWDGPSTSCPWRFGRRRSLGSAVLRGFWRRFWRRWRFYPFYCPFLRCVGTAGFLGSFSPTGPIQVPCQLPNLNTSRNGVPKSHGSLWRCERYPCF